MAELGKEEQQRRFLLPAKVRAFYRYPLTQNEKPTRTTPLRDIGSTTLIHAWMGVEKENKKFLRPGYNPHHSFYGFRQETGYYLVAPQPSFADMEELHCFDLVIPVCKI